MRPGFLVDNANRDYPFLAGTTGNTPEPLPGDSSQTLRFLPTETIVDAGFLMGLRSGFVEGRHNVWMSRAQRFGDAFYFTCESDAPGLLGFPLVFCRKRSDTWFTVEHLAVYDDDGVPDSSAGSSVGSSEPSLVPEHECVPDELWAGFLSVGSLIPLAEILADGQSLTGRLTIEPGELKSLVDSYVHSINLANADRTRTANSDQCKPLCWDYELGEIFVAARCLQGPLRFREGYNCAIRQNDNENSLLFSAVVGAGAGLPCEEVPLFAAETPPVGGFLLDGSITCNEAIRTINGTGASRLSLVAGVGVSLTAFPTENRLLLDVNLQQLQTCLGEESSLNSLWPDIYGDDPCDCGPVEP